MGGRMDAWKDGWMDKQLGGKMDGYLWIDERQQFLAIFFFLLFKISSIVYFFFFFFKKYSVYTMEFINH